MDSSPGRPLRMFGWFYLFTFLLLALVPLIQILAGVESLDFDSYGVRASAATGIAWTSSIFSIVRLAFAEPALWLLVLGSAVPTLAAIVALLLARDAGAWRRFGRRLLPYRSIRGVSLRTLGALVVIVAAIAACLLLTRAIRGTAWGGGFALDPLDLSVSLLPLIVVSAFLDQGAMLEEAGWRGYATPTLQRAGLGVLQASCMVGLAWAAWHLPRDIVSGLPGRLGLGSYLLAYLPAFTIGCIAVSIVATLCSQLCGGSLYPAILVHGMANDAIGLSGAMSVSDALTPAAQLTKGLPILALAIVLAVALPKLAGRRGAGHQSSP